MWRRSASVALALVVAAATAFGALLALVYGFGLQCDESCEPGGSWKDDPAAWEWQLFGWAGVACLCASIVLLAAAVAGLRRLAFGALAVWVLFAVTYGVLISGGLSAGGSLVAVLVVLVGGAGLGSVWLLAARPVD